MDLVFEHVKADRGIILLLDEQSDELIPKVVRIRDETDAKDGKDAKDDAGTPTNGDGVADERPGRRRSTPRARSSTTSSPTAKACSPANAMADQRFSKGKSVHNLGIRSALCVPIKARKLDQRARSRRTRSSASSTSTARSRTTPTPPTSSACSPRSACRRAWRSRTPSSTSRASQAERLAAVGETTAALSHSIKNILQALRGGADVVEMGLKPQQPRRRRPRAGGSSSATSRRSTTSR